MVNIITPSPQTWDHFVASHPRAHFLQQPDWGDLKADFGWTVERVALEDGAQLVGGAQLLFRRLPFRLGTMAYLPMGPLVTQPIHQAALWDAIHKCARKRHAAFLKWEPGIFRDGEAHPDFARLGFLQSAQTIQPPRTILIDISGDDETILARMNQGTRRKIRQSQKNDVRYKEATREEVKIFTDMMQVTGERKEFGIHEPAYYARMYDLFVPASDAALILAEHEGDPLAGILALAKGKTAWYLAGASTNVKRNLMAAYGVQWLAIQWAKARGCTVYDLWGIPDESPETLEAQFENRQEGLWGVYGFKRGWGGEIVRSPGAWDKVYNPLVYQLYLMALKRRGRHDGD